MKLLTAACKSSLAESGIIFKGVNHNDHPCETIRYGGHQAEYEVSATGRVTKYKNAPRYSFPPESTEIEEIYLCMETFAARDINADVAAALWA